jgi:glycosyltransferase involved in cell wall biosynthesis
VGNDPESLAVAIEKIREMNLARMGEKGWMWMRDNFSWQQIALEILETYKSLLNVKGKV